MNQANATDAGQPVWQHEINEIQDRARSAFLAQEIDELRPLLSDDFVVNSPINRILTKSELLDLLQRNVIRHFFYEEQIEFMTRQGDFVVVMGRDTVTNTPDGPPVRRRFTNLWREADDSWQLVARHAHHLTES